MSHDQQHFEANPSKYTVTAILSFLCVFAVLMLFMNCHGDYQLGSGHETAKHAEAKGEKTEAKEVAVTEHESIHVKLPDGKELNAYKGGIEDKLVAFLNDAESKAGKEVWFDFDNLNFESGKAVITEDSKEQVANIAAILAAYPKLKIKIGGYTDKTGDAAINKKLSQERADAVLNALKGLNAKTEQLVGAEGYGSEFAKAAADATEAEKKLDRHISIGVREK